MDKRIEWDRESLLRSPLFLPLHPVIASLGGNGFPSLRDFNALLDAHRPAIAVRSGQPLRFVEQQYGKLPFEAQYEPRCYLGGEVPTRPDNWHDLFNALVWLVFPQAKAAINERHYRVLTGADGVEAAARSQRGATRDAITLLDESGVIVPCADDGLADLLLGFQWKELFWRRRALVRENMGFFIFGHGLHEKALHPYVGMTGQGLLLPVEPNFFGWPLMEQLAYLDGRLADYLSVAEHCRSTRELTPVPLLGVPGWAAENAQETYYDNTDYFRAGRQSRAQRTPPSTAPSSVAG
ncbi:MAG: DUF3025 domain-containing protein [Nitrosomonadales bacterium]|nr:DUF3025 domain-containing protein [Nitrosomonadales bacterium]